MTVGGFVGYSVIMAFGYKERAKQIKFFILLMISLSILNHGAIAINRVSEDVKQVRQDIQAVKEAGEKAGQLADSIKKAGESPIVEYGGNASPPARNFWEYFTGGKFSYPLKGQITQGYNSNNHGIDIAASKGTAIKAARDGKVIKAESVDVYGLTIIVDHGDGWQTLYAHCSEFGVKSGQKVFEGDAIALVGSTGNSTGPHLHFEIRFQGKTVDPVRYLK